MFSAMKISSALTLAMFLIPGFALSGILTPYEYQTAWEKKQVRVCWGNQEHQAATLIANKDYQLIEYTSTQKKWIQDIVSREFTLKETGIEFIGWEPCGSRVELSDVVLFRYEPISRENEDGLLIYTESGGSATIGQRGQITNSLNVTTGLITQHFARSTDSSLNVVLLNTKTENKVIDPENYIKMVALHEFGHTAGLRHQHIRFQEAKNDPNCKRVPHVKFQQEPTFSSTRFAGPYDYNSIMNYCWINVLMSNTGLKFRAKSTDDRVKLTDQTLYSVSPVNEKRDLYQVRIGLSKQDKQALKCMYAEFSETQRSECPH